MNTCNPCNGRCNQGRTCPANTPAEACTDVGADDYDPMTAALFWNIYAVIIIVALIAAYAVLA